MNRAATVPALPRVAIAAFAFALGTAFVGYRLGHDAGRIEGRAAAYRETDRVLRDLEHALAPLVQGQAPAEQPTIIER